MQASANVVDPALGDRRPSPRPYRPLPGPGARGARPRQAWWPWPLVIAVSTLCAVAAALGGWEAPFRPALVLWFVLVCPGMALVRLLRLGEPVTEWTLAVALSVTLDI